MSASQASGRPVTGEVHVIPPASDHTASVIFLHGLGQRVQDWIPFINTLAQRLPGVKWILPQAPNMPVTMNDGHERPSWFDVFHMPPCTSCGGPGSAESVTRIEQIILAEMYAIAQRNKVIVVGFSQGAALGMLVALTSLHELGGVASLSGWIPHRSRGQMAQSEPNLPVFWGHGTVDETIPFAMGEECVSFLRHGLGLSEGRVLFKTYHGLDHTVSPQETRDLADWLAVTLG